MSLRKTEIPKDRTCAVGPLSSFSERDGRVQAFAHCVYSDPAGYRRAHLAHVLLEHGQPEPGRDAAAVVLVEVGEVLGPKDRKAFRTESILEQVRPNVGELRKVAVVTSPSLKRVRDLHHHTYQLVYPAIRFAEIERTIARGVALALTPELTRDGKVRRRVRGNSGDHARSLSRN